MNNCLKVTNGKIGNGVKFERIRRITGYLVGTIDRWNDGKRAELSKRVKHSQNLNCPNCSKAA